MRDLTFDEYDHLSSKASRGERLTPEEVRAYGDYEPRSTSHYSREKPHAQQGRFRAVPVRPMRR
jgi:hypothetical protein